MEHKTTMFYDGGCPVCLRGVRHYQRMDWARRLRWVDITYKNLSFGVACIHLCNEPASSS